MHLGVAMTISTSRRRSGDRRGGTLAGDVLLDRKGRVKKRSYRVGIDVIGLRARRKCRSRHKEQQCGGKKAGLSLAQCGQLASTG
jgi:hypothetical protein